MATVYTPKTMATATPHRPPGAWALLLPSAVSGSPPVHPIGLPATTVTPVVWPT